MSQQISLYVPRDTGLHRLHPLTKLALTGLLLVGGLTLPGVWPTYAVFCLLVIPLAAAARVLRALLRATWPVVLPFAISLFIVQGIFWPGGTPLIGWGPVSLKVEGVLFAIRGSGRILVIVSSFLLLSLTTRPDALMIALSQRGLPDSIAYIVLTTIQIVPRFQAKANMILDAQRARGLETEGNLLRRIRALLPLVVPLILGSIVDIEERAMALEARAFSRKGEKTSLMVLSDSTAQKIVRWAILLIMVGLIAGRVVLEIAT
jgi:energy-coupling factor transport system permease protein